MLVYPRRTKWRLRNFFHSALSIARISLLLFRFEVPLQRSSSIWLTQPDRTVLGVTRISSRRSKQFQVSICSFVSFLSAFLAAAAAVFEPSRHNQPINSSPPPPARYSCQTRPIHSHQPIPTITPYRCL